MIVRLHAAIGSRWSIIAQQLPGRTDNDVKNYWNGKLKKKLTEMGIDPVTHKPFSQILADYGSIGGFPKSGPGSTRIGSLNRDLKNAFLFKSDDKATPIPKTDNNNSMDLLAQLQAIKLVTSASHVFGEGSSTVEPPFSWRDFLLEDPVDGPQEEEEQLVSQSHGDGDGIGKVDCGSGAYRQNPTSFVETMLEQNNQMMPDFPQLLDEPFYY